MEDSTSDIGNTNIQNKYTELFTAVQHIIPFGKKERLRQSFVGNILPKEATSTLLKGMLYSAINGTRPSFCEQNPVRPHPWRPWPFLRL
jgi:hypothetical protein